MGYLYQPEIPDIPTGPGDTSKYNLFCPKDIEWTEEHLPYAVIAPDHGWVNGKGNEEQLRELFKQYGDHLAIVVDCHS